MPTAQINGISIYYEVHGRGEPLVLIGGFGSDHTIWNSVIEYFIKDYQLIVFDNRVAGQTEAPVGPYSIKEMTEDLVALCAALGLKKAHFIGHSMGGFILQQLASHYPELIKSAIMNNTTTAAHTVFHNYLSAQLELLKAGAPLESLIKASCSWAFSDQFLQQPGVLNALIQMTLTTAHPFTLSGYEGQYAALEGFDSRDWVNQIKVPTLVLASDQDLIFREPLVKSLAQALSKAQYYCFSECGHIPQIEHPELFVRVV